MAIRKSRIIHTVVAGLLLVIHVEQAAAAYNPAYCQSIAGTLNIHWQAVAGPFAPCVGIEFTNGTLADAADGSITMAGTGVSNPACIGTAAYAFVLTPSKLQLIGADTASNVPMILSRGSEQGCFVGTWSAGADVYEAYIWAGAFPLATTAIPSLGLSGLLALAALLAMAGVFLMRLRTDRKVVSR